MSPIPETAFMAWREPLLGGVCGPARQVWLYGYMDIWLYGPGERPDAVRTVPGELKHALESDPIRAEGELELGSLLSW